MGPMILDDPLVYIMGHDMRMPTISVVVDFSLKLRTFLLELESCFFELLVPRPQLLHP